MSRHDVRPAMEAESRKSAALSSPRVFAGRAKGTTRVREVRRVTGDTTVASEAISAYPAGSIELRHHVFTT